MLEDTFASLENSFDVNAKGSTVPGLNASGLIPQETAYGLSDSLTKVSSSFNLPSIEALDAGVFTVGETGKVSFDYLFDGGGYEGELAIFNLKGMEQYGVGSKIFIQEAALRASQNDSDWGYVVVSDRTEGAKFSGNVGYEPDLNAGDYLGTKTFSLRPGTQFGVMLVPDATVKNALCGDLDLNTNGRPLFSISNANPEEAIQFAQVVKLGADSRRSVNGNTFSFEDLQLNRNSDRDYNDLVFQLEGAIGGAPLLDEIINPDKDWRKSQPGEEIIQNAVDPEDLAGNTIDKARIVGVASAGKSYQGWVGSIDTDDYYTFALGATNDFSLSLDGLSADANVELLDTNGNVIQTSANSGTTAESINTTLSSGAYSVRVTPFGNASTSYNLELAVTPKLEGITTGGSEELEELQTFESLPLIRVTDTNPANPTFNNDPRFTGINGAGLSTVIIDTGINLNHPFFGPDSDLDGIADRIVANVDFANPGTDASDTNPDAHGTNVSSIVASQDGTFRGVAPDANIIHLKVFPDGTNTTATVGDIEQALQWVIENAATFNIASVNMSLGQGNFNSPQTDSRSDELQKLADLGVIVVSASGNFFSPSSAQGVGSPSADPNSLSIGAVYDSNIVSPIPYPQYGNAIANTTNTDRIAPFSQRSQALTTVFAPGAAITGAGLDDIPGSPNYTSTMSGTSQAAPHVSGMAVLAQQLAVRDSGRRLTPGEFRELLSSTGVTINDGDDEDDNVTNTGLNFQRVDMLNLGRAISNLQTVAVTINRVSGDLDSGSDSDFYSLLSIDGGGEVRSATIDGKDTIFPNWELIKRNITTPTVPITIKIYDEDGFFNGPKDHADINPNGGNKDLNLIYNLVTGSVTDSNTGQEYGFRGQQINLSGGGDDDGVNIGFTIDGYGVTNPSPPPVTVNVYRVKGDFDGIFNDSDFYAQLSVAGKELRTPTVDGNSDLTVSNWNLSNFVTDRVVPVSIKIFDEDSISGDDHIDINPNSGNQDLNLFYDQVTGIISDSVTGQVYGNRGRLINLTGRGDDNEGEIWFIVDGPPLIA